MKRHLWKLATLTAIITYPIVQYGIAPQVPTHLTEYVQQLGALLTLVFFLVAGILLYENDDDSDN